MVGFLALRSCLEADLQERRAENDRGNSYLLGNLSNLVKQIRNYYVLFFHSRLGVIVFCYSYLYALQRKAKPRLKKKYPQQLINCF